MKNDIASPSLIKIGKTVYVATPQPIEGKNLSNHWKLVAKKGSKQVKDLFESKNGSFTLWSSHPGMMRAVGTPKPVEPQFMGKLEPVSL